jgi:hypothetical protein
MTLSEANALLDAAVADDKPSRINPALTRAQAVDIVRKGINSRPRAIARGGINLDPLMEKRVLQVTRNQRRPKL